MKERFIALAENQSYQRIYSNDAPGTVQDSAEYSQHDEDSPPPCRDDLEITMPMLVSTREEEERDIIRPRAQCLFWM